MYRVVQDLTHDELDELKLSYLSVLENDTEYPAWLPDPEDISDEVLNCEGFTIWDDQRNTVYITLQNGKEYKITIEEGEVCI